jgi:hypothetical protein
VFIQSWSLSVPFREGDRALKGTGAECVRLYGCREYTLVSMCAIRAGERDEFARYC